MASHAHTIGGGAKALPFDIALSVIPSLPRPMLARFVARAIERMDEEDSDPDLEDATDAEDEGLSPWARRFAARGPGCVIGDPGGGNVNAAANLFD